MSLELDHDDFSASNGWLESFLKRYNIRLSALSGESAEVPMDVIEEWTQRLPDILAGYDPKDVFNADETGLYFRALPDRTYAIKGDPCKGTKTAKDRITVLLACSAAGEKLTPLVIGRSAKPRCFRKNDILPVIYRNNKKAWMTAKMFTEWLNKLNNKMIREKQNILLFVDNCSGHPHLVLSNIKLVFLPPNTTSHLQPCDAGIIQTVKLHYRKRFMRHVLSEMDEVDTASELVKTITVRDAICWLDMAWDDALTETTIMKCFRKCGFATPLDVPSDQPSTSQANSDSDTDPVANTQDPSAELGPNYLRVMDGVTWEEFANCDRQTITTCEPDENDSGEQLKLWMETSDDEAEELPPPLPPTISNKMARFHVKDLVDFAYTAENQKMLKAVRALEDIMQDHMLQQSNQAKQKNIKDFFAQR